MRRLSSPLAVVVATMFLLFLTLCKCFQTHSSFLPRPSKHVVLCAHNKNDDDIEFEPLDVMLERARKRGVNPMIRVQAFLNAPVAQGIFLARGDVALVAAAVALGAKGFALGLVIGKFTMGRLQGGIPPLLIQLYPVLLAIICDQVI